LIPVHKSTDSQSNSPSVSAQPFLGKEFGLLDRYEAQSELVRGLEQTKFHAHLASKVMNCHKKFRIKRCKPAEGFAASTWAKADNSCFVRLCPHCSHRKVRLVSSRVKNFVVGKTNLKYVVFAERNSVNLAEGIKSLYAAWDRLRRSVFWKSRVSGAIVVLEVTYSKKRKSWHPHLNVLFEGDYIPFEALRQRWEKATKGEGRTAHIQKADEGTILELIKYTLKIAEYKNSDEGRVLELLFEQPEVLDEFLSVLHGMRVIRTYGTFRQMGDVEAEPEVCPDCGSDCIVDLGWASHDQLSFDFDKQVFRVKPLPPGAERERYRRAVSFDPCEISLAVKEQMALIPLAVEARHRMRKYEKAVAQKFAA
jgi:hypothetical protein